MPLLALLTNEQSKLYCPSDYITIS